MPGYGYDYQQPYYQSGAPTNPEQVRSYMKYDRGGFAGPSDPSAHESRAPRPSHNRHERPSRDQYGGQASRPAQPVQQQSSSASRQQHPQQQQQQQLQQQQQQQQRQRQYQQQPVQQYSHQQPMQQYSHQQPVQQSHAIPHSNHQSQSQQQYAPDPRLKTQQKVQAPTAPYGAPQRPASPRSYSQGGSSSNSNPYSQRGYPHSTSQPDLSSNMRSMNINDPYNPPHPQRQAPSAPRKGSVPLVSTRDPYQPRQARNHAQVSDAMHQGPPVAPYAASHRPHSPGPGSVHGSAPKSYDMPTQSIPDPSHYKSSPQPAALDYRGHNNSYDIHGDDYGNEPYNQQQETEDLYSPQTHANFYPPPRPIQDSTGRASPFTMAKRMYDEKPPNNTHYPSASSYDLTHEQANSKHNDYDLVQEPSNPKHRDYDNRSNEPRRDMPPQATRTYAPINPPGPSSPRITAPGVPDAADYQRDINPYNIYDQYDNSQVDDDQSYTRTSKTSNTTAATSMSSTNGAPMNQRQKDMSTHIHTESMSSDSSNGAKPPPKRNYSAPEPTSDAPASKVLTIEEFERLRRQASNRPQDFELQLELGKKYVEAASVLANRYSDPNTPSPSGYGVDGKHERKNRDAWMNAAFKLVKRLAHSGYAPAIFYFGSQYSNGGMGLEIDYDKAYELYLKAANKDHAESAYRVAVCNEIGAGTKRDPSRAINWYKKASLLGDVSAMYKLGMISLNGLLGQPRSFMEAVTWLQRAAERADKNSPHAVHELGLLYERADTLDMSAPSDAGTAAVLVRDDKKAYDLFLKAAKLGYAPSQFHLGAAHEYGTLGCSIDPKRSIAWYSRAAEKGEPESELALSGWYLTGSEGILTQSDTEAYLWARKAAEKGLAKAEYALGYFSEVGIGIKPNIDEAKKWYYKAAAQRHPKALSRLQELKNDRI